MGIGLNLRPHYEPSCKSENPAHLFVPYGAGGIYSWLQHQPPI